MRFTYSLNQRPRVIFQGHIMQCRSNISNQHEYYFVKKEKDQINHRGKCYLKLFLCILCTLRNSSSQYNSFVTLTSLPGHQLVNCRRMNLSVPKAFLGPSHIPSVLHTIRFLRAPVSKLVPPVVASESVQNLPDGKLEDFNAMLCHRLASSSRVHTPIAFAWFAYEGSNAGEYTSQHTDNILLAHLNLSLRHNHRGIYLEGQGESQHSVLSLPSNHKLTKQNKYPCLGFWPSAQRSRVLFAEVSGLRRCS